MDKKNASGEHFTVPQTRVNAICCRAAAARPHKPLQRDPSPAQFVLFTERPSNAERDAVQRVYRNVSYISVTVKLGFGRDAETATEYAPPNPSASRKNLPVSSESSHIIRIFPQNNIYSTITHFFSFKLPLLMILFCGRTKRTGIM